MKAFDCSIRFGKYACRLIIKKTTKCKKAIGLNQICKKNSRPQRNMHIFLGLSMTLYTYSGLKIPNKNTAFLNGSTTQLLLATNNAHDIPAFDPLFWSNHKYIYMHRHITETTNASQLTARSKGYVN